MSFQENLKKMRKNAGYTGREFAKLIGLPYPTYSAYESQGREPKFSTLIKIADALHVSIDELLGHEVQPMSELEKAVQYFMDIGYDVKEYDYKGKTGKEPYYVISSPGLNSDDLAKHYKDSFHFKKEKQVTITTENIINVNRRSEIAVPVVGNELILLFNALIADENVSDEIKKIRHRQAFTGLFVSAMSVLRILNSHYWENPEPFETDKKISKENKENMRTDIILSKYFNLVHCYAPCNNQNQ